MTDSRSGPRRMRDRILGDGETARLERGYRLVMNSVYVVGVLFVIALIGMGVMAGFGGVKSGVVSAMLTAVTGVIGSLVGAYFGIQVGTQGRQQVEDRAESRAERIESRAERARAEAEAVARRALAAVLQRPPLRSSGATPRFQEGPQVKEKPQPDEIQHLEWNHMAHRTGPKQGRPSRRRPRSVPTLRGRSQLVGK